MMAKTCYFTFICTAAVMILNLHSSFASTDQKLNDEFREASYFGNLIEFATDSKEVGTFAINNDSYQKSKYSDSSYGQKQLTPPNQILEKDKDAQINNSESAFKNYEASTLIESYQNNELSQNFNPQQILFSNTSNNLKLAKNNSRNLQETSNNSTSSWDVKQSIAEGDLSTDPNKANSSIKQTINSYNDYFNYDASLPQPNQTYQLPDNQTQGTTNSSSYYAQSSSQELPAYAIILFGVFGAVGVVLIILISVCFYIRNKRQQKVKLSQAPRKFVTFQSTFTEPKLEDFSIHDVSTFTMHKITPNPDYYETQNSREFNKHKNQRIPTFSRIQSNPIEPTESPNFISSNNLDKILRELKSKPVIIDEPYYNNGTDYIEDFQRHQETNDNYGSLFARNNYLSGYGYQDQSDQGDTGLHFSRSFGKDNQKSIASIIQSNLQKNVYEY